MRYFLFCIPLVVLSLSIQSCNRFKSCPERLAEAMPLADSLFLSLDSSGFHHASAQVKSASTCILEDDQASAAEQLYARLSKARVETHLECWSCHSQIHGMAEFYAVLTERSSEISDKDWKEAMALWNAMVYDVEHPSMKCTDEDRAALMAMKAELTVLDVVGGGWQDLFEEAGEKIENALDQAEDFLKRLFED